MASKKNQKRDFFRVRSVILNNIIILKINECKYLPMVFSYHGYCSPFYHRGKRGGEYSSEDLSVLLVVLVHEAQYAALACDRVPNLPAPGSPR